MAKRKKKQPQKERQHDPGRIDFLGKSQYFAVLSVVVTITALVGIFAVGFNYGIDFAGGTEIRVQLNEPVRVSRVRQFMDELGYTQATVQSFGATNEYLIRLGTEAAQNASDYAKAQKQKDQQETLETKSEEKTNLLNAMIQQITNGLTEEFANKGASIRRVDSVGPQIGNELKRNGILAAFYSLLLILIYVGLRFDYKYAPGAVFCLFHDSIITMGVFAFFGLEVNVHTMAAILTIIGYSLNDTIVIYDRIRENVTLYRNESFRFIVNRSLNDTLSRTVLTSVTTLLAVGAMYFLAGGVIQDFALTLAIGLVLGTYSSIYVAAPLVLTSDRIGRQLAST